MTLDDLMEKISKACCECKKCDPCCTAYVLKRCIEDNRLAFLADEQLAMSN